MNKFCPYCDAYSRILTGHAPERAEGDIRFICERHQEKAEVQKQFEKLNRESGIDPFVCLWFAVFACAAIFIIVSLIARH